MTSKESVSMITIETSRLLLRNYRETDFEDIIKREMIWNGKKYKI